MSRPLSTHFGDCRHGFFRFGCAVNLPPEAGPEAVLGSGVKVRRFAAALPARASGPR